MGNETKKPVLTAEQLAKLDNQVEKRPKYFNGLG
jgi:hypothetical protein